jgi:hypothetical protein
MEAIMWFRFSRPDYFYARHYRVLDASDESPFNRGVSIGFGFFVLHCRWNEGRSESDGIHYLNKPHFTVVINGERTPVARDVPTYEHVAALAGKKRGVTVVYSDRAGNRHGTLCAGQRVLLSDGMEFTAVFTGSA